MYHYFEDIFSRSDSIGGYHALDEVIDSRLSFGEGFANALSGIIGYKYYTDTGGYKQQDEYLKINMESEFTMNNGFFNELTILKLIYDLLDDGKKNDNSLDDDNISLTLKNVCDVLLSPNYKNSSSFTTIYLFIHVLKELNSDNIMLIDKINKR